MSNVRPAMYAENTRPAGTRGASGAANSRASSGAAFVAFLLAVSKLEAHKSLHQRLPRHRESGFGSQGCNGKSSSKSVVARKVTRKPKSPVRTEPFGKAQCRSDEMRMQNANASLAVLVRVERANAFRVQLLLPGLQVEHTRIMKRSASARAGSVWQAVESGSLSRSRSNPSIEGTCNIWLRQLSPAPHVKR